MKKLRLAGLGRRAQVGLFVLTGVLLVAGMAPVLTSAAAAAPRMTITGTSFDFGEVFEDKALNHTFTVANTGDEALRVEEVDPDCACTVPSYDRVIPPGGRGEITLTIKPYSVMRDFLKHTTVRFNDPARPEMVLTLKGYVQPIIEIQPSHIIRLRGTVDEDLRGRVRFISHLSGPWRITGFDNRLPRMVAVSLKEEDRGKVYVLEVRNLRRDAGHYAGVIKLQTTSRKRPLLIVRVFANLYPSRSPGL